jgi:hypothetical protein
LEIGKSAENHASDTVPFEQADIKAGEDRQHNDAGVNQDGRKNKDKNGTLFVHQVVQKQSPSMKLSGPYFALRKAGKKNTYPESVAQSLPEPVVPAQAKQLLLLFRMRIFHFACSDA